MSLSILITMLITLTLVAAIMLTLPRLMARTVPLGVSVPVSRADEPVIAAAVRRYRLFVVASWAIAIVVLMLLVSWAAVAAALVSQLVLIAGTFVSYVVARQAIVRAKRAGEWYAGVPVRIAGEITDDDARAPVPVVWFAVSLALIGIATAIGIGVYDTLPPSIPMHWDVSGTPDPYAPKTVWNVFWPLILAAALVVGLFALSFLNRVVPVRALPSATAEENAAREHGIRSAMSSLLGQVMFALALGFSWLQIVSWLAPTRSGLVIAGIVVMLVVIAGAAISFIVRWRRAVTHVGRGTSPDAPDDDHSWKGGIFYVNRDDPAVFVQRRFGAGWTINLGHPAGIAIGVGFVVVIVALVTFALTAH